MKTYTLFAVIGRGLQADLAAADRSKVVDLADGYQLVHLRRFEEVRDEELTLGSWELSPARLDELRARFAQPPARALVEAELCKGAGYHFAAAWSGTAELLAPMATSDDPGTEDPPNGPWPDPPRRDWAVNRALRAIGVIPRDPAGDELEHLGLDRRRIRRMAERGTGRHLLTWAA